MIISACVTCIKNDVVYTSSDANRTIFGANPPRKRNKTLAVKQLPQTIGLTSQLKGYVYLRFFLYRPDQTFIRICPISVRILASPGKKKKIGKEAGVAHNCTQKGKKRETKNEGERTPTTHNSRRVSRNKNKKKKLKNK
jgi:hypothetical protein